MLADSDLGIARGDLTTDSGDLRRLIGRPTTSVTDYVATVLKG
jgi:NAD(P)H dehydrogenase (quinone)